MITTDKRQTDMFNTLPGPVVKTASTDYTTVDYSTRPVGSGWGHRKVTVACPKCGKPGIFVEGPTFDKWIHCEELRLDHKNSPRKRVISSCNSKAPK